MEITVLGSYGPYPAPGGACSGYLFQHEDVKILLDCGNGILSRLQQIIHRFEELDMIILTHLHSDHISDAMILRYAIGINQMKGVINKSIPLYAPSDPKEDFEKLQFQNAFLLNKIEENRSFEYKGLVIEFRPMEHPIPSYGIRIANKDKKFVYSGDTSYCEAIVNLSREADLFLCEAGLLEKDMTDAPAHLSAKEVGEIATKSNVKKVLLTHFWPGYDLEDVYSEAKSSFKGELILSTEMKTYSV